jgi:hypothetical protein
MGAVLSALVVVALHQGTIPRLRGDRVGMIDVQLARHNPLHQ